MREITNIGYGTAKAAQVLASFNNTPSPEDNLEKGHTGKLDTSKLVLRPVVVDGKMQHRWCNPTTGQEHAKHGSKIVFEHKGEKKVGVVGSVMKNGEYAVKGLDGKTYGKHPHQFASPHVKGSEGSSATTITGEGKSSDLSHGHPDITAKKISEDDLEELDEEGDSDDVDINEKFDVVYPEFVSMVAEGMVKSGIAYGVGGVGKTYGAINTLKHTKNPKTGRLFVEFDAELHTSTPEFEPDEEASEEENEEAEGKRFTHGAIFDKDAYDWVKISGKATTSGVIQAMWEHNGKMLVFDDCDTALTQPDTIMMFKGALDSTGDGKISSLSARPLKDSNGTPIPSTFKFTGRAFFISNLKGSQIDQAIKSRSLRIDLTMTVDETLERMKHIAQDKDGSYTNMDLFEVEGKKIKYESGDMEEALKFLEKNKNKTNDLNMRTLGNVVRIIHSGRKRGMDEHKWKSAAKSFIFSKANDDDLSKGGIGSGRKLGTTKSGKIIYDQALHPKHKDFTFNDHQDAVNVRNKVMKKNAAYYHLNEDEWTDQMKQNKLHGNLAYEITHPKIKKSNEDEEIDIEKAFDNLINSDINKAFDDLINPSSKKKDFEKGLTGPGSRGGKISGYTKSGEPIYGEQSKKTKDKTRDSVKKPKHYHYDAETGKVVEEPDYKIDKTDKEGFSKVHYSNQPDFKKAFDNLLDYFEKGKFNKVIQVQGKFGPYQRVQLVGSDKTPLRSKHHGMDKLFADEDKQKEYENHLHSLVEHEGKYYKLEDKNQQMSSGRGGAFEQKYKGATEHTLHPDEIAYKNKLHRDQGTSAKSTDHEDLKNRISEDRFHGTDSTQKTAAYNIIKNREGVSKEDLRKTLPHKEKVVKEKTPKPIDEEKEHKEYQRYVTKSVKEINSVLNGVGTIKDLSTRIKTDVSKKAVLKKDTPISFVDSKGEKRTGEWGQFKEWINKKAENPDEADKKIPFKNVKIEFKLDAPDEQGWEKVNYVKKAFDNLLNEDTLTKFVGSPGSRGGKVIGYTSSGKPIYDDKNVEHKGFNKKDHLEAADFHEHLKTQSFEKREKLNHKISKLPDHKLFTDEHQSLYNQENEAYHNMNKHEKSRMFHLAAGLKDDKITKAVKDGMKDEGWGNNSVVLGNTKSKKEVYSNADNTNHKDFDEADHTDAYTLHGLAAVQAHSDMGKHIEAGDKKATDKARDVYDHHSEQYDLHRKLARESAKKAKEVEEKKTEKVDKTKTSKTKKTMKKDSIEKAFDDILNVDYLSKGGPGSGRKIGTTKSGKDIYHNSSHNNDNFTKNDHSDAAKIHAQLAKEHLENSKELRYDKNYRYGEKIAARDHSGQAANHRQRIKLLSDQVSKSNNDTLSKAEFSTKDRKKLAKEGEAEKGGSYPIRNSSDLANAIKAIGRSKDPEATKRWIKKRAKELDKEDMLPSSWSKSKVEKCDQTMDLNKALQSIII